MIVDHGQHAPVIITGTTGKRVIYFGSGDAAGCVCGGRCQKCRGGLRGHIGAFGANGPDTGAVLAAEEALQGAPSGWSGIGRAVAVGVATGTLLYVATRLVDSLLGFRR